MGFVPIKPPWVTGRKKNINKYACVRACACVCFVSVIVKRLVLPSCAVDGRSRNPLYYYYLLFWECVWSFQDGGCLTEVALCD